MTRLDLFNECARHKGYQKTRLGVSWKVVGDRMYFEQTRERTDWLLNVLAAIPFVVRLRGRLLIVPLGAALGWFSVRQIVKDNPVATYGGYSQGGWWASFASAETGLPAITFGCPNLYLGDAWIGRDFLEVTHYETPTDCVCNLPPWARKGSDVRILNLPAQRPDDIPEIDWIIGHAPAVYRKRLEQ